MSHETTGAAVPSGLSCRRVWLVRDSFPAFPNLGAHGCGQLPMPGGETVVATALVVYSGDNAFPTTKDP